MGDADVIGGSIGMDNMQEFDEELGNIDPEEERQQAVELRILWNKSLDIREKSERGEFCVPEVIDVIEEGNKIAAKVRCANSAYLDALVLHNSSISLKNCMDTVGNQLNDYQGSEFAARLNSYFETHSRENEENKMKALEALAIKSFRFAVSDFSNIKGEIKGLQQKEKKPRQQRRRENLEALPTKRPRTIDAPPKTADLPQNEINSIMKALVRRQNKTNNAPVPLFELLINPHSYLQTVENIFCFSHVYKGGYVESSEDEFGLPMVKAIVDKNSKSKKPKKDKSNAHCILKLDEELWKKLVKHYQIKEPMIPPKCPT